MRGKLDVKGLYQAHVISNVGLCPRLFVVSTKVGGVPEVLPNHMINYATPEEDGKDNSRCLFCVLIVFEF